MPELPRSSGNRTVAVLRTLGFEVARQRGSHIVLRRIVPGGKVGCAVPLHKQLAAGTLREILRQAHVTVEEFVAAMDA